MKKRIISQLQEALERNKCLVCATVAESLGHSPSTVGTKMLVSGDGSTEGTVGGGALEHLVIKKALEIFSEKKDRIISYDLAHGKASEKSEPTGMVCGGSVKIYFEYFGQSDQLIVFGGGHVGSAIVYHALPLGFSLVCIDSRPEFRKSSSERFHVPVYESVADIQPSERNFAVIASYSHDQDYVYLEQLLSGPIKPDYTGVIASARKWKWMKEKLAEAGISGTAISGVYSPAGLSCGGESPDDIAISVLAEMNMVRYGISGPGHLRDLKNR